MADDSMTGRFVDEGSETWYRIDGHDSAPPFFVTLASDSDLWTFVSTAGSLAAGRRDQDGAFFPYETVDKIHLRWEHTGPRTWILVPWADGFREPFAPRLDGRGGARSVWKNLSGTRRRFREEHPSGRLVFQYEWSTAAGLGLVRTARLEAPAGPVRVSVLDGLLNLVPPGVSFEQSSTMSSLADAYKWNESAAGGRLALYTLYARIWDRPEPKESFEALAAWHAGLPADTRTLLSAHQLRDFCRTGRVEAETLTRGRRGAFLENFDAEVGAAGLDWHLVVDAPRSQAEAYELARHLQSGGGSPAEITAALARNTAGLDELLARADAFQVSGDRMAAAHHRVNVLFNCMRGGVFVDGTCFDRDDLLAFVTRRSRRLGPTLRQAAADLGEAATPLAEAYERLLGHHAFTGRPGTMFGYEGLGCASTGTWSPSCCWPCRSACSRRRTGGRRSCRCCRRTTAACVTASATAAVRRPTAPFRPTPTATPPAKAALSSPA